MIQYKANKGTNTKDSKYYYDFYIYLFEYHKRASYSAYLLLL